MPSLPVLPPAADAADMLRAYHRAQRLYSAHLGEETALEFGTAYHNVELPRVWDANILFDLTLHEGVSPETLIAAALDHYARAGTRCRVWVPNPSMPAPRAQALEDALLARGMTRYEVAVLRLEAPPRPTSSAPPRGVSVLPARAAFAHARALFDQVAAGLGEPQVAEGQMLHMDDPHWDALLALRDGQAVAHVGVFAVGDVGLIEDVYVAEPARRCGIGRLMLLRAIEIARRSLFRHVILGVDPANAPALALYASVGLRPAATFHAFRDVADVTA